MAKKKAITNKSFAFNKKEIVLAEFANAISHPAKLEIIKFLSKNGGNMMGEIANEMPIASSTVFQHMEGLVKAKLVLIKKENGAYNQYYLNKKELARFKKAFNIFFV